MSDDVTLGVANDNLAPIDLKRLTGEQKQHLRIYFREARKFLNKDNLNGLEEYVSKLPENYRAALPFYMNQGYSLIHHCIKQRAVSCMVELLEATSKPSDYSPVGMNALVNLQTLRKNTKGFTPLHLACLERNADFLLTLTAYNPDPGIANEDGQFPLHIACRSGDEKLVHHLLEYMRHYAPELINHQDAAGMTPLHIAMACGYEKIAQMLINEGADKTIRCHQKHPITGLGMTPYEISWWSPDVQHMVHDFTAHVVLPAMLKKAGFDYKEGDDITNNLWHGTSPDKVDEIMESLEAGVENALFVKCVPSNADPYHNDQLFFRPLRLQRTWHHPPVNFPSQLLDLNTEKRSWKSLLPDGFTVPNSPLRIVDLNSAAALKDESLALHHSAGTSIAYVLRCCSPKPERRSHILSIQDEQGHPLSTIEVKISKSAHINGSQRSVSIPVETGHSLYLHVMMHRGADNSPILKDTPSALALDSFLNAIEDGLFIGKDSRVKAVGKLARNDERGKSFALSPNYDLPAEQIETDVSRAARKQYGEMFNTIGYIPSWERIEECFYEYRDSQRASSTGVNNRKLEYDKLKVDNPHGGKPYEHYLHFIDGYYDGPNKAENPSSIDMRQMDVRSWLQATGLNDSIDKTLEENFQHHYIRKGLKQQFAAEKDHPDIKESPTKARDKPVPDHVVQTARLEKREKGGSFVKHPAGEVVPFQR